MRMPFALGQTPARSGVSGWARGEPFQSHLWEEQGLDEALRPSTIRLAFHPNLFHP